MNDDLANPTYRKEAANALADIAQGYFNEAQEHKQLMNSKFQVADILFGEADRLDPLVREVA